MIESRRRAYLEAMGFDIWSAKPLEPVSNRLILQAGGGDTLLICEQPDLTANRFAADVARALAGKVVWAWPDPEGSPENPSLEEAVGQYLFTCVVLFGKELHRLMFKEGIPPVVGSARVLVTDGIEELAVRGSAKLAFWNQLSGSSGVRSTART